MLIEGFAIARPLFVCIGQTPERNCAKYWKSWEFLINCVDFCHDSAITKQALMALTAPKVNCVDFCHDSAIAKQALMALAAPKIENLGNFWLTVLTFVTTRPLPSKLDGARCSKNWKILGIFDWKSWEFWGGKSWSCYVFCVENKTICIHRAGV